MVNGVNEPVVVVVTEFFFFDFNDDECVLVVLHETRSYQWQHSMIILER